MSYIDQLHDKKRRALEAGRAIVSRANEEGRAALNGEEEAAYARVTDELRELDTRIGEWNDNARRVREADEARASVEAIVRPPVHERPAGRSLMDDALVRFFRGNGGNSIDVRFGDYRARTVAGGVPVVEHRDVYGYAGAGTLGGMVPNPEVAGRLYQVLLDQGAIWRLNPEVVHTSAGNPVQWPAFNAAGTATITSEGGALVEADPTFGTITTTPRGYKHLLQLSNEILQDAAVDLVPFVGQYFGYSVNKTFGSHACVGDGSSKPQGYMGGSVTVQAAGTCSPDSAIRLQMSVSQQYRAGAVFATNAGVLSYWRRLRADAGGTTGPWLLAPPSAPGMAETLYGSLVVEDANIVNHGSAVKSVAYGDFQRGYLVHDAGLRIERSDDYAFANDLASFRVVWRLDGAIRDTNAIAVYQATAN